MSPLSGDIYSYKGITPQIDPETYIAPGAKIIGDVKLGAMVSVWFNAVLRGDLASIEIGEGSNVQDLTTIHIEGASERGGGHPAQGVKVGRNVTIGHNCLIHGCILEDECLIGMNSVILNGAHIGRGSIIGAGAVVLEGAMIPPFSLVVGNPGKIKKTYPESIIEDAIYLSAKSYQDRILGFRQGLANIPNP